MTDNFRMDRIERLLRELKYEVERGMMEREIMEEIGFRFYVPFSNSIPGGVVFCDFHTRPIPRGCMHPDDVVPRLQLIKDRSA